MVTFWSLEGGNGRIYRDRIELFSVQYEEIYSFHAVNEWIESRLEQKEQDRKKQKADVFRANHSRSILPSFLNG